MAAFGADGRCLMRALQEELDDPDPPTAGSARSAPGRGSTARWTRSWCATRRCTCARKPLVLDVKKMAPDAEGKMKKLADGVRAEEGRALARLGDGGWDPLVQSGRREGRFDDELVAAAAEAVRAWRPAVGFVTAVPSRRSGALVPEFAAAARGRARAAVRGRARARRATTRRSARWPTPPSRWRTCAASSAWSRRRPASGCLLVDDIRFSGWTLAMIAGQLRRQGATAVYPLALSTAF